MMINSAGLELIKSFEGLRLIAYKDPTGIWTIGYGHTSNVTPSMKITEDQADAFLQQDLATAEKAVNDKCKDLSLNENEFSALVSFTYNCGPGNLTKLIKNRSKDQISDALLLYNKAGGKTLQGLVRRREAEQKLFKTPPAGSIQQFEAVVTVTDNQIIIERRKPT